MEKKIETLARITTILKDVIQNKMEDHLILRVDQHVAPQEVVAPNASCSHGAGLSTSVTDTKENREYDASDEDEPRIQSVECRICQEEDSIKIWKFLVLPQLQWQPQVCS